jgi:hypothetical protein
MVPAAKAIATPRKSRTGMYSRMRPSHTRRRPSAAPRGTATPRHRTLRSAPDQGQGDGAQACALSFFTASVSAGTTSNASPTTP